LFFEDGKKRLGGRGRREASTLTNHQKSDKEKKEVGIHFTGRIACDAEKRAYSEAGGKRG